MDYTNLQNKTVFDFCNDKAILKQVLPALILGVTQKDYESRWIRDKVSLAFSFLDLAEVINDSVLEREVEEQFKNVLNSYFDE